MIGFKIALLWSVWVPSSLNLIFQRYSLSLLKLNGAPRRDRTNLKRPVAGARFVTFRGNSARSRSLERSQRVLRTTARL